LTINLEEITQGKRVASTGERQIRIPWVGGPQSRNEIEKAYQRIYRLMTFTELAGTDYFRYVRMVVRLA